jgi:predicted O-linked N-acetylglucosamine transferase (SPINDLY family)
MMGRAVHLSYYDPLNHGNMGNILKDLGRHLESEARFRVAIQVKPDHFEAYSSVGNALKYLGLTNDSLISYRRAIIINPLYLEAHINLGDLLSFGGDFNGAINSYRRAISIYPGLPQGYFGIGISLHGDYKIEAALEEYVRAVYLKRDFFEARNNMAGALYGIGNVDGSIGVYRGILALSPEHPEVYYNMGISLGEIGKLDESIASYRRALNIRPDYCEAHSNRANVFFGIGRIDESSKGYRNAIKLDPGYSEAYVNFGISLEGKGLVDQAEAAYRKAIKIKPNYLEAYGNLLFLISGIKNISNDEYLKEALCFGRVVAKSVRRKHSDWLLDPYQSVLRVGFVSGDLRNHPVGYFIEGLCNNLNPQRIELVAFQTKAGEDDLALRLKPYFSEWHSIVGLSDEAASQVIHQAKINVLIDLSGHTACNRLGVFAYKPAPIQVTWLGYWASTGVSEIDYLLADPFSAPYGVESHYIEKLWRLPETRFCFTPPATHIPVSDPPYARNGFITFSCFNNLSKITDHVISVWSEILLKVPGAKLYLKAKQLGEYSVDEAVRLRFYKNGIESSRLILEGPSSRQDYLGAYNLVDIVLDPFPYPGGTTTLEALWMGVPVLTRKGNSILSRKGESIANNIGKNHWIAENDEEYVKKAVCWASDIDFLLGNHGSMRL